MCGIVGYYSNALNAAFLGRLLDSMYLRGPDGEGRYDSGALHMGMRRLAIIDLAGGSQPLLSRGDHVIAFQNGEIYNHRQLRRELEGAGYQFSTHSDTEVLAHGYACWGLDGLLDRIDGMYAIAIHDRTQAQLHLARDRYGEKPLFYTAAKDQFGYASTLTAASAFPWVSDNFDLIGLDRYLALHFIPGDRTILADVRQLLPGESLTLTLSTGKLEKRRYWRETLGNERDISDDELAGLIEEAVASRLIADVPVGVFLSGGLDSSLVAALAARRNPHIATFSMGFGSAQHDESAHAAATARHIGSNHFTFQFDQNQFLTLLPKVAAAIDTPIGDQAALPLYWLAQEARKQVTVALSGEAADEVFGGYGYYRQFAPGSNVKAQVHKVLDRLRYGAADGSVSQLLHDSPPVTASGFPLLTQRRERQMLVPGAAELTDQWEQTYVDWLSGAHDRLQEATAADIATWLPDDLLVKFDRMCMAHSLEGRAPFLHPGVVTAGLALPQQQRMGAVSKVALRRIAERYLPREILDRPKQGFVLPMGRWLSEWFRSWQGPAHYFRNHPAPGIDNDILADIVSADLAAGVSRERLLFAAVMLSEWWQCFKQQRAEIRSIGADWSAPLPDVSALKVSESAMAKFRFELDTPTGEWLEGVTRFSGWFLDSGGLPANSIVLTVDGEPRCQLLQTTRVDVGEALPDKPHAALSGFVGDLVLNKDHVAGDRVTVEFIGTLSNGTKQLLAKRKFDVRALQVDYERRPTLYDLKNLLVPDVAPVYIAGVPHFHDAVVPMLRLLDKGPTHGYGRVAQKMIDGLSADGLFLDFGCGIKAPHDIRDNAVLMEAVHFPGVDVVSTRDSFPFSDDVFDLVISQAVFEHLADPHKMSQEIWRVLKPGGRVLIDTAFMQPLHGDPDHYNNMTLSALRLVMRNFIVESEGIQPHQMPSYGLKMQIEAVLPFMQDGAWRTRMQGLLAELYISGAQLDKDLGPIGQKTLAAGYYVIARKP